MRSGLQKFSNGIFVPPYFCFRLEANATTCFTIGDDTNLVRFDVPGKYSDRESYWAMTIWAMFSKSHVFPALSPMKQAVQKYWSKDYDALRAIIVPYTLLLLNSRPF